MFPYIVAGLAILLFVYEPVLQYFSSVEINPINRKLSARPSFNESLLAIDIAGTPSPEGCPTDAYSVHIFSKAPLVIYIENFLTAGEREYLLEVSNPLFQPSTLTSDGASTYTNTTVRDSSVALLPRTDPIRCIERRALSLQGWRDDLWIERLRTQRYVAGGHYAHHFDWGSGATGWGRVGSMMAWVGDGDIEGGGTEFPLLRRRSQESMWCQWIDCPRAEEANLSSDKTKNAVGNSQDEVGVAFKPIAGNAVYWENFRPDGSWRGWEETWHAGLPVKKGVKVGLNIWSWGRLE